MTGEKCKAIIQPGNRSCIKEEGHYTCHSAGVLSQSDTKLEDQQKPKAHVQGDAQARKAQPIVRGCLDYFPDALLAVAELSRIGNEQHNPGQPLHWAKEKSTDEADALLRHLIDRGTLDTDGVRHSAKVAWRALALLQREIEAERNNGK